MKNILKEICDRRLQDISQKGFSYGHEIPAERTRPVVPFLPEPGTILEVKRASPSKGDIAPGLDCTATAASYIKAGTSAISVLTEENYFKGTLDDLKAVAGLAHELGDKTAVLRKDFLLEPEEIEIAYKCGADAVLLIARILDTPKLLQMAQKAFELGLSILLELRDQEAVDKAFEVLSLAVKMNSSDKVVLGINARDLKTFTIDMLIPLKIKKLIEEKFKAVPADSRPQTIRVISESGVLDPKAAALTASLGFDGILIGEAVAKDPEHADSYVNSFVNTAKSLRSSKNSSDANSDFWSKIAVKLNRIERTKYRPLVKICGITNTTDAIAAVIGNGSKAKDCCGADILGFIMEPKFARHAQLNQIPVIVDDVKKFCLNNNMEIPAFVAVITMPESYEARKANEYCKIGILDAIQFHGCQEDITMGYKAMRLGNIEQIGELDKILTHGAARVLVDAYVEGIDGGTGISLPGELVEAVSAKTKLWLAGGINPDNVKGIIEKYHPELIDISSGVEKEVGQKDHQKIEQLFNGVLT